MRRFNVSFFLSICLVVAGCTSSRMDEILSPSPSPETTSSISRPNVPTPAVAVGATNPQGA
ncbi:MAG: glycosyl hydrolase, partial [Pseudaminobacter sp.]